MQINIRDIWSKEVRRKHKDYVDTILKNTKPLAGSLLDQLLKKHGSHIPLGKPKRLRAIIITAENLRSKVTKSVFNDFLEECKTIFDYGTFAAKNNKNWNAYGLCSQSNYQLCPYCQQAGALTIYRDPKTKSFRPTLDHFYPKSQYPYLALSLYNLVPSCHTCNSSLKSTCDFYIDQHLHPFEDEELIRYDWNIQQYLADRVNSGPMPGSLIRTEVNIRSIPTHNSKLAAANRSIQTFLLEERLSLNSMSLRHYQEALLRYSGGRLKEVNDKVFTQAGWTLTEGQALQFSYKDYKDEWMGRLKADLYEATWHKKW